MAASIPPQRRSCATYDWCTASGQRHHSHVGELHVLDTSGGTELRVSLSAQEREEPRLELEVAFQPGGPSMEVAALDAAEAVELAGVCLRLARIAQSVEKGIH